MLDRLLANYAFSSFDFTKTINGRARAIYVEFGLEQLTYVYMSEINHVNVLHDSQAIYNMQS